jgi:hypothetical protein
LVLFKFDLLAFFNRDNLLPTYLSLDITDECDRCEEAFATKGRAATITTCDCFVVLGPVEDIVEIHIVQLLVLLCIIFVKPELKTSTVLGEKRKRSGIQLLGSVLEDSGELLPAEIVWFCDVLAIASLATEVSLRRVHLVDDCGRTAKLVSSGQSYSNTKHN